MRCRQSDDWNQLVHTLAADSTQLRHDDGLRKCCCQSYDVQPSGGGSWSHRSREQRRMPQRQLGWMPQGGISVTSRFSDTPRQPHHSPTPWQAQLRIGVKHKPRLFLVHSPAFNRYFSMCQSPGNSSLLTARFAREQQTAGKLRSDIRHKSGGYTTREFSLPRWYEPNGAVE